ncbi:MAG: hypothetical protein J7L61_02995, partial [Thermoplasmata archaeon]|nr:hypothetical protein [Thermoplasmata archaeon]
MVFMLFDIGSGSELVGYAAVIFIIIAGVWMTILTYLMFSRKRRQKRELVEELKRALQEEKSRKEIVALLNELMEGTKKPEAREKIKTVKKKVKKVNVTDIADLMEELDEIAVQMMEEEEMASGEGEGREGEG